MFVQPIGGRGVVNDQVLAVLVEFKEEPEPDVVEFVPGECVERELPAFGFEYQSASFQGSIA